MNKKLFTLLLVPFQIFFFVQTVFGQGSIDAQNEQFQNAGSLPAQTLQAQSAQTTPRIEVLERLDCQHCKDEKEFLTALKTQMPELEIRYYDITEEENRALWAKVAELEKLPKVTPITLIGTTVVQGFDTAQTTGEVFKQILQKSTEFLTIEEFIARGGSGQIHRVEGGGCDEESATCGLQGEYQPLNVNVPFIGLVDVKKYSLPVLSIILGFVDGFNPCAMWVLVTFLIILLQVGDKKKMWQIAGLFILAEAIMYYLILNVWFGVWDFVGLDNLVTPIVGAVAIGGGIFFLYEWKTSDGTCKVTDGKTKAKTRSRMQALVSKEFTILSAIGIIGLAFSVNIIEFACSIGIPQAFTKILDINVLSFVERQFYMALYILFYMIDDLIVFGLALYSAEKIGITTKYSKMSNLIGGVLMLILGGILLLKPELLVF